MRLNLDKVLSLVLLVFFACGIEIHAQHVSFGTWAAGDIVIMKGVPETLNFNDKKQVINPGISQTVTINLNDPQPAVLTIEGTEYMDVTVYIDAPVVLDLDPANQIPVAIRFAYSNLGTLDMALAKNQAIEVPVGFNTATFPILRRINGPPGPPPTPPSSGYIPPRKKAWLFIYGTLGPVGSVNAGMYSGIVNVTVEYTKNN
ncbi:MAG: hypothetical protein WCJ26_01790 [bacterium]